MSFLQKFNASLCPKVRPKLDPDFLPAFVWTREYQKAAKAHLESRALTLIVQRPKGQSWTYSATVFPNLPEYLELTQRYLERLVKFLLWAWGGSRVQVVGAPEHLAELGKVYSDKGERAFDNDFLGTQCFGEELTFSASGSISHGLEGPVPSGTPVSRILKGCRIGFDLGGSDRKCAALIDGEVVFSEEVKWSPYFESDPSYHWEGIQHSLERAASHLPRVDAIGGSAAGIYIDNEPRVGSLFRGVAKSDFEDGVRLIFHRLKEKWGNVPFEVVNDGDVTAIAGALAVDEPSVLGVAMGTSQAVGYVGSDFEITGWLNELAFAPVDYRGDAPIDEWSGDRGCGVQYFSQQAVARLLPSAGIEVPEGMAFPEQLENLQELMAADDKRASEVYDTIGVYLGYALAHYADFYEIRHLIVLGRVTSGAGGELILQRAREVLREECPELLENIVLQPADEKMKRHGQAVAAASLPKI